MVGELSVSKAVIKNHSLCRCHWVVAASSITKGSLQGLTQRTGIRIKWKIVGRTLGTRSGLVSA